MAEAEEIDPLALAPGDARFVEAATESAFATWQRERMVSFNRAANRSAIIALGIAMLVLVVLRPAHLGVWLLGCALLALLSVGLRMISYRPALLPYYPACIAATNGAFGLTIVVGDVFLLDAIELAVGVATLVCFFGFTFNRTPPKLAALGASTYLSVATALIVRAVVLGTIPVDRGALEVGLLVVAFSSGWGAARTIAADARRAYRQERVIEQQARTIARERARAEDLLKQEVAHQVAERSRELGAVLARSDVTLDVRQLSPGERFASRYRVVGALGAGGMGAVYEVERVPDSARLALKAIVGQVSGASAARFAREAEIGARVRHPNVISIVDVGVASGAPFLVMELVRGGSLESQRARFGDVAWARPILQHIALGLSALHDAGVVHRDLKPANVLLDGSVARISDFGISRFGRLDEGAVDPAAETLQPAAPVSSDLTGTGMVMGTPRYMAPEGAQSARALDGAADVFALGFMAFEMLTGRAPFDVPLFVLAMAQQPLPTPPSIDDGRVSTPLARVIVASLAGDPARRPKLREWLTALA